MGLNGSILGFWGLGGICVGIHLHLCSYVHVHRLIGGVTERGIPFPGAQGTHIRAPFAWKPPQGVLGFRGCWASGFRVWGLLSGVCGAFGVVASQLYHHQSSYWWLVSRVD